MMPKRQREHHPDIHPRSKRARTGESWSGYSPGYSSDPLSSLSDEVLLRTFSFLPVSQLVICERLSRRFQGLATDSQLWKSAYYDRFVRPRASRIPGARIHGVSATSLRFSSKVSKWLDDDYLVRRGKETDWKRQYRLRHNWAKGICNVSQTRVADRQSVPPLLARFYDAILVTVDSTTGLRAWSTKNANRLLATMALPSHSSEAVATPTAMTIDTSGNGSGTINIAIGFSNGASSTYQFLVKQQDFQRRFADIPPAHGAVEAIAFSSPYLLTMTENKLLSLYRLDVQAQSEEESNGLPLSRLLSSLESHTARSPFSLAIRVSSNKIFASIAYAMPTYLAGWSVGLQELSLTSDGTILDSRLTSAVGHSFTPPYEPRPPFFQTGTDSSWRKENAWESNPPLSKPTSLTYTHPYILAAHPDNTLTFYMVTSDAMHLSVRPGCRLWGHTSSVSGAYVGDRGKAVSVGRYGNDVRVWELESGLCHGRSKRRTMDSGRSVRIWPEMRVSDPSGLADHLQGSAESRVGHEASKESDGEEFASQNGWVAFDDEKVLLLKGESEGPQMVVVYDFS